MSRRARSPIGVLTGKPEVTPPGWQISPDKRSSRQGRFPEEMPTSPDQSNRGSRIASRYPTRTE